LKDLGMIHTDQNIADKKVTHFLNHRKVEKTSRYIHYNDTYIDNDEYFEGLNEDKKNINDIAYAKF